MFANSIDNTPLDLRQGIRFALTLLLCFALFQGCNWARWVSGALLGVGCLGAVVAGILLLQTTPLAVALFFLGQIYAGCACILFVVPSVCQFFAGTPTPPSSPPRKPDASTGTIKSPIASPYPLPEFQPEIEIIQACRDRFGPPPRSLSDKEAAICRLELSPRIQDIFEEKNDSMLQILVDQHLLRDRGKIVWGHLIQANQRLFDPNNTDTLAADVIYSLDPYFDGRARLLRRLAQDLFTYKGTVPTEPELQDLVRAITNERERIMGYKLPLSYCRGKLVFCTTCFLQPSHMPEGFLAQSVFPLLVNLKETKAVMMLPYHFWPSQLINQWRL
ncbi:hypothetical protein ACQ4M4_27560 [Leptolyngbya sp. AN02str]|uniref:hypothetical protein n=1 Tax=Leptolyngbya sp. AN02str TaxID=3423363 RepID=UPI003D31F2FA